MINKVISIGEALGRSRDYFMRTQDDKGYWCGELESNVTMAAEYLLLTHFLGCGDKLRWKKVANYLKENQRADGSWSIWFNGPPDLNASVESYFALKMAGVSADDPMMIKARNFILSEGGLQKTRIFTRIWLSLFGQWSWKSIPCIPVEFMLMPLWFPLNIYKFACWARGSVVPMMIIFSKRPICQVPDYGRIDELQLNPNKARRFGAIRIANITNIFSWSTFFKIMDKYLNFYECVPIRPFRKIALSKAVDWIIERQEADGSWGGIQPPWVYSLMALKVMGYQLDHPVMKKGIDGIESFAIEDSDTFRPQACVSPVWDTALAMIALHDSGIDSDHPNLVKGAQWLIQEQVLTGGDWQLGVRGVQPGHYSGPGTLRG